MPLRGMAGLSEFIKWSRNRERGCWDPPGTAYPLGAPPPARVDPAVTRVTFVNHAPLVFHLQ
ncbi:MAG: hypothetical protein R2834_24680, partial [Rhodothermales bacterium]